jgi:hypothetical protein
LLAGHAADFDFTREALRLGIIELRPAVVP